MYKNGFVTLLVITTVLVGSYLLILHFFGHEPNELSKQLSRDIIRYPNAKSWELNDSKRICEIYINQCSDAYSRILFTSNDPWRDVYRHYRTSLTDEGWYTESQIITSVPTSIIFTQRNYYPDTECTITVKEEKQNLLGLLNISQKGDYSIKSVCS